MVYAEKGLLTISEQGSKVRITKGAQSYACDLSGCIHLPLPYGDGCYTVDILERVQGNRYNRVKRVSIDAKKTEGYLLQHNLYVPYSPAWQYARELVKDRTGKAAYDTVCCWVKKNIVYDYIKAVTVSRVGVLPDPLACWNKRMGICQDIASLTAGMLRAVGVPAKLVIGRADKGYHAWVETAIGGNEYRFDRCGTAKTYKPDRWY